MVETKDIEKLFATKYDKLFKFIINKVGNNVEIAEDVLQEGFLKAIKGKDTFRGECSLETWVTATIKYIIFNRTRDKKRHLFVSEINSDGDTIEDGEEVSTYEITDSGLKSQLTYLEDEQFIENFNKFCDTLPEKRGFIFRTHILNDIALYELAEENNINKNTCKAHYLLALKEYKKAMYGSR